MKLQWTYLPAEGIAQRWLGLGNREYFWKGSNNSEIPAAQGNTSARQYFRYREDCHLCKIPTRYLAAIKVKRDTINRKKKRNKTRVLGNIVIRVEASVKIFLQLVPRNAN